MNTTSGTRALSIPAPLLDAVDEALNLLDDHSGYWLPAAAGADPLPSLLEQCQRISAEVASRQPEPIRTLHHFACTGGTLFSKLLAASANTQVLSEIDPLSTLPKYGFTPSDLILQLRYSAHSVTNDLLVDIFTAGLQVLYEHSCKFGERLVLRDHSHSHFCTDQEIGKRPTLLQIVQKVHPTLSVVTVRHPLDSFLDLSGEKTGGSTSLNLDEYAHRYQAFLDAHENLPIFKYESLIAHPKETLGDICTTLELPFDRDIFDLMQTSNQPNIEKCYNDDIILPYYKNIPTHISEQIQPRGEFSKLCTRLGYNLDLATLKLKHTAEPKAPPTSSLLLEKTSYENNKWFSAETFSLHKNRGDHASDIFNTQLLEVKSLPRSGMHYLRNSFEAVLKNRMSFCEWYQEPGCCKKMPCIYTCFGGDTDKNKVVNLRMTKSHDFELSDPAYPPLPSLQRVILLRDPIFVLTSWWVLDVIAAYKDELLKRHLNVSKLYYRHEPVVLAAIYQALEELFEPSFIPSLHHWLESKVKYIIGFCEKWGRHTAQTPAHLQTIVRYEDLPAYISGFLTSFQKMHQLEGVDCKDMFKSTSFKPRPDPFSVTPPKLEAFLRQHSESFQSARQQIIMADTVGVFNDLRD